MSLSHLICEIANVFMHSLLDKKLRHSYVSGNGLDWLAVIVVKHVLDLSNKCTSFLIRIVSVRLPRYHTFLIIIGLFWLFLNLLHYPQIDNKILWNLCIDASSVNAKQYSMTFPNFWKSELCHDAAFLTEGVQLILVCCTVDKTWNKAHMHS